MGIDLKIGDIVYRCVVYDDSAYIREGTISGEYEWVNQTYMVTWKDTGRRQSVASSCLGRTPEEAQRIQTSKYVQCIEESEVMIDRYKKLINYIRFAKVYSPNVHQTT